MAAVAELNAVEAGPAGGAAGTRPGRAEVARRRCTNDPEFAAIVLNEFRKAKGSDFIKATQDAASSRSATPEFQRAVHKAFTERN